MEFKRTLASWLDAHTRTALAIALQIAGYSAMVSQMRYIVPVMPFFLAFGAYAVSRVLWRDEVA